MAITSGLLAITRISQRSQDPGGAAALADSYINFPNPFAAGRAETRFAFNLTEAATVGRAMAEALAYTPRVPEEVVYAYPGERRWKKIFFSDPTFHEPEYMAIDLRSKYAFEAIGTATTRKSVRVLG